MVEPLFVELTSNGPTMSALSSHALDLELGEDVFIWPHPIEFGKALFMVDDATERAMGEATFQSHEGVRATLSKLGEAAATIVRLGVEVQH